MEMFVVLSNEQVLGTTSSWMQEEFSAPNSILCTNVGSWYLCQFLLPMSVLDTDFGSRHCLVRSLQLRRSVFIKLSSQFLQ